MALDTRAIETLRRAFEAGNRRFIITAEIKPVQPVAPYLSTDLLPIKEGEGKGLSISGDVYERNRAGIWRETGGGQCQDELRAAFPDDPQVQRLCDLWDEHHLCDMNAGSREQQAIINDWAAKGYPGSIYPGRYEYSDACTILHNAGKLEVPIPNTQVRTWECPGTPERLWPAHKPHTWDAPIELSTHTQNLSGEKSQYCPKCGRKAAFGSPVHPKMYKYGSAWLCGVLPPGAEAELRELMNTPPPAVPEAENRSQYASLGITMTVNRADANPNMPTFEGDHWKCTLSLSRAKAREQGDFTSNRPRRMTVYFSKGYGHHGEPPTLDELMETLTEDARSVDNCGDFEGFCSMFGYDTDSRTAERTWKAMEHQAARLKNFLGSIYEVLQEA